MQIVSYKNTYLIKNFDYHCNLLSLVKYLNITYDTLYLPSIYKNIDYTTSKNCQIIIKSLKKNTYIFNWQGNPENSHEKYNRKIELTNMIPLFSLNNINR